MTNPRKGGWYVFQPVLGDHNHREFRDYVVRVIGCPGMPNAKVPHTWRYVETLEGNVIGMVYRNSLVTMTREQNRSARRIYDATQKNVRMVIRNDYSWECGIAEYL